MNVPVTAVTASTFSFAYTHADGVLAVDGNFWFYCNEALTANPKLNFYGSGSNIYGFQSLFCISQAIDAGQVGLSVCGGDVSGVVRPIVEDQMVNNDASSELSVVEWYAQTFLGGKHCKDVIYGFAGAPYYQVGQSIYENGGNGSTVHTVADWTAAYVTQINNGKYEYDYAQRGVNAKRYGVKYLCYEGGCDNAFDPARHEQSKHYCSEE